MSKKQLMTEEEEQLLAQREQEIMAAQQAGMSGQVGYSAAMFAGAQKQNLVEWQLDFRPELEDIEHLLRCDIIVRDKDGQEHWSPNPNNNYIVFNSQGVNDIIRYIRMFLNKNKVLSFYKAEEIKPRVRMLGHELRCLILNNYEEYGMDTPYKQNNYSFMVLTITDMIDSAYRRAINGEERRDLNQARVVQQNEAMVPQNINFYPGSNQNKKGLISRAMPWNWGK